MKSTMPYYGVTSVPLRAICKRLFAEHPLADYDEWRSTILSLWREASHREERYAALALAHDRRYRRLQTLDMLPVYEELIVSGAWWDTVDDVATHLLSGLLHAYPAEMKPILLDWSRCDDMWKRRSSIICQVGFKTRTDVDLLYRCIEPNLADTSFWLRKAIGWALRAYAWTDPDEVRRYVATHDAQLSGLSKREALKNIGK